MTFDPPTNHQFSLLLFFFSLRVSGGLAFVSGQRALLLLLSLLPLMEPLPVTALTNLAVFLLQVSSLLKRHPGLQEEFWEFFQQLHGQSSPVATSSETAERDCVSQNPPDGNGKRVDRQAS